MVNVIDGVDRVVVVGTGLLGGSIGLGLRAAGFAGRIVGVGRREQTVARARELGCIDLATTDLEAALRDDGLVVLATPLGTFADLFRLIGPCDHPGLVFTDVGSTKQQVCRQAKDLLPDPSRFVGSHPMAGSDRHGPQHARADLFQGKPCIMTADEQSNARAVDVVRSLWTTLGMHLVHISPQEHDRKVATVSHLPHLLAALLVRASDDIDGLDVASTGFGDVTRLARSDPNVWLDIFASNRSAVGDAIEQMIGRLEAFGKDLGTHDDDGLLTVLRDAKRVREQWAGPGGDSDHRPDSGPPVNGTRSD